MGLDMYLYRNGIEVGYWRKANAIHGFFDRECAEEELRNCQEIPVVKSTLQILLSQCQEVLSILNRNKTVKKTVKVGFTAFNGSVKDKFEEVDTYDDEVIAEVCNILPPTEGFFFGSYTIDNWYMENIKDTIKICENVLNETDWESDNITYLAWW